MKYDVLDNLDLDFLSCNEYTYKDLNDCTNTELIVFFKITNQTISEKLTVFSNPFFLYAYKDTLKIRIPLIYDELRKYFANYKDYYYLPMEDMCILKSVAGSVDNAFKENAKKETCYIKYRGFFIPNIIPNTPGFKYKYNSKITYMEYNPKMLEPKFLQDYAYQLIGSINNQLTF